MGYSNRVLVLLSEHINFDSSIQPYLNSENLHRRSSSLERYARSTNREAALAAARLGFRELLSNNTIQSNQSTFVEFRTVFRLPLDRSRGRPQVSRVDFKAIANKLLKK